MLVETLQALIDTYGREAVLQALQSHTCKRCGHTWTARGAAIPAQCPACHNRGWRG